MENKDWYEAGEKIGDLVQKAIDAGDFGSLSQTIGEVVSKTVDQTKANVKRTAESTTWEFRSKSNAFDEAMAKATVGNLEDAFDAARNSVSVKGAFSMAVGGTMAFSFGFLALMSVIAAAVYGFTDLGVDVFAAIMVGLTLYFRKKYKRGKLSWKRARRLKKYVKLAGGRDVVTIAELAGGTGQTPQEVLEDLRELIANGSFSTPAYLDEQGTTLMLSSKAWQEYSDLMQRKAQERAEQERREAQERAARAGVNAAGAAGERTSANSEGFTQEQLKVLEEGREFIAHIHECNEQIPEPEFTRKLNVLENTVNLIFNRVERNPESVKDLHRMMSYYLPITRKLVDAYRDLEGHEAGANVAQTRAEISASLDTINTAFAALLDSFFEDTAMDISTDISTLKTMMAQDGLTGRKDFTPGGRIRTTYNDLGAGAAAMAPEEDK